jgi:DNA-3-methyladenine glycosylase II
MDSPYREPRLIATEADLDHGIAALSMLEPLFATLHAEVGRPPLRRVAVELPSLLNLILDQQVSLASAAAIRRRFAGAFPTGSAAEIAVAADEMLTGCGLSRPKARAIRAVAKAVLDGELRIDRHPGMAEEAIRAEMLSVRGIGPWTAEMWLLAALGRPDAWPSGDLALQVAAMHLLGRPLRPDARELDRLAEPWRPWRAVAARLLWGHYARGKMPR